jgi:hypothetical protein
MLHLDTMFCNFIQGELSVSNYYRKMKSMANSLADLDCTVSDCNLILNVLRELNKLYDHLRAIIMRRTPFPSFHKVWENLVLEELTLIPNMPAPPLQAFYSNNTPAPPPPAPSRPLTMAARVKDRVTIVAAIARTMVTTVVVAVAATLPARATRSRAASLALPCLSGPPSIILGLGPSTCTMV